MLIFPRFQLFLVPFRQGVLIQGATNSGVAGVPLEQTAQRLIIGIAGGVKKVESILAALHGKLSAGPIAGRCCRPSYS